MANDEKISEERHGVRDADQRIGRRAVRRRLYKQLRRAVLSHLRESEKLPAATLLETKIQIAPAWERWPLGLLGVAGLVGGWGVMTRGGDSLWGSGMVLGAIGATLVVAACRGRRKTVRAHLNSLREGLERAAEESVEELVCRSLKKNNALDDISPVEAGEMAREETDWVGMGGEMDLGDLGGGVEPGDIAGGVAGDIVGGIFSGL